MDNGFGSFFEAEVKDAIDHGFGETRPPSENSPPVIQRDAKELQRFKLHLKLHPNAEPVDVLARNVDGETQFFVKRDDLGGAEGHLKAEFGIELDTRSSMLATALRTSHLCWFRKCGYGYVFPTREFSSLGHWSVSIGISWNRDTAVPKQSPAVSCPTG